MEIRVSSEYDGKRRILYGRVCGFCGVEFYAPKHRERKYCSVECSASAQSRNNVEIICAQCGKKVFKKPSALRNSVHKKYFCSRACKDAAQCYDGGCPEIRPSHYSTGKASYRDRALREHGAICSRCGYKELEQMLDVHHIDCNRAHNQLSNLVVLCVWCHALYTRKILGSSPNWHGTSLAKKNSVDSTSTDSTNFL